MKNKYDRLLLIARDLIYRQGLSALSHERLAKAAGIGKSTCLYYFPNKEALLAALVKHYVQHLDEAFSICLKNYENAGSAKGTLLAFRDWYLVFRTDEYRPWRKVGYQIMMAGAQEKTLSDPIRKWYKNLYTHIQNHTPPSVLPRVMILLMTFDHLFNARKLGYDVLNIDEENRVIDEINRQIDEIFS